MVAPSLLLLVLISCIARADASIPRSGTASHPSQSCSAVTSNDDGAAAAAASPRNKPAWNASPKINTQGYLCELFRRIPGEWEAGSPHTSIPSRSQELNVPVIIRQVPGDGDCLFHAVAISLNLIQGERHLRMDSAQSLSDLKLSSRKLRRMAVECLRSCNDTRSHNRMMSIFTRRRQHQHQHKRHHPHKRKTKKRYKQLFIQGCESMSTSQLLSTAASQYGISSKEYCDLMQQDSYWEGGPEIVALCNVLKRPIHVYELVAAEETGTVDNAVLQRQQVTQVPDHLINKEFRLRCMATFGSPRFDSKPALHILSADSRFPDVQPNCIIENGNHFMAIFPVDMLRDWVKTTHGNEERFDSDRKRRVRGGAATHVENDNWMLDESDDESWLSNKEWFNNFNYSTQLDNKEGCELEQSSDRTPRHSWYHKILQLQHWQSLKHSMGFWINIFVWTLSHFQIGY